MIVKMKFLSLTGPVEQFDRVVETYLTKYNIHLENALSELKTVKEIGPFAEANPYKDIFSRAEALVAMTGEKEPAKENNLSAEEATSMITSIEKETQEMKNKADALDAEVKTLENQIETLKPFTTLPFELSELGKLSFIKYHFGKISTEFYGKFEKYVYDNIDTIFCACQKDKNYVWGVYFVPEAQSERIDAIYSSMHFESAEIPEGLTGQASDVYQNLIEKVAQTKKEAEAVRLKITEILHQKWDQLAAAYSRLSALATNFDVRKMAVCTKEGSHLFFILCGWMPAKEAKDFEKHIGEDVDIYAVLEDDYDQIFANPPTEIKNPKIFKPFELYTKMYGLPAYNEIDPTIFVALTYSFIFGWMFGDVGQGIFLFAVGLLLYLCKHIQLCGIIASAGVFSTFFGFMFGSVFGYEEILPARWIRPLDDMATLPFIGRLNVVLIFAICFGIILLIFTMIMNIINDYKAKNMKDLFFGANGISGLVFYVAVIICMVLFMSGKALPATIVLLIMFIVPLLLIVCKDPISKLLMKIEPEEKTGPVMFVVQGFFELFEMLLSYFSNTLSFVRIGAFAVSHVAMMQVVMMLAGAENGGTGNMVVIVLGNLFVIGMEGLIVGIQVLRLEYYEFFSRFYKGTGRPFVPYKKSLAKHN